ncbi:MAG: hypothetical protein LQ349_004547 [Xanthoria aureola]|nr:MAG: hypothetical protein LQ349_004547 [Xanthoria aureola]
MFQFLWVQILALGLVSTVTCLPGGLDVAQLPLLLPATPTKSSEQGECIFSYTSSGTPVFTSGFTVLPHTGFKEPYTTVPCGDFLRFAYRFMQTATSIPWLAGHEPASTASDVVETGAPRQL